MEQASEALLSPPRLLELSLAMIEGGSSNPAGRFFNGMFAVLSVQL